MKMQFKTRKSDKQVFPIRRKSTSSKSYIEPQILKPSKLRVFGAERELRRLKFKEQREQKEKLVREKSIPTLTGVLGSAQPKSKALAFRVWVHPAAGGDDFCYEFATYKEAQNFKRVASKSPKFSRVEPIIGVFKKKLKKYPSQQWWEARLK